MVVVVMYLARVDFLTGEGVVVGPHVGDGVLQGVYAEVGLRRLVVDVILSSTPA